MDTRQFIEHLDKKKKLIHIRKEVSKDYELAQILAALDGQPVIFENIKGHNIPVAGNLYSTRDLVAEALKTKKENLLKTLSTSITNLKSPEMIDNPPCQEIIHKDKDVNLNILPIMRYLKTDGGAYIPSAIVIVKDKKNGRNVCFHRLMVTGKDTLVARIVENRGTYNALKNTDQDLECAIVIGNSIAVLLAASTSLKPDEDEFALANAIEPTRLARCRTVDIEVPADSEIVFEGKITRKTAKEGPFLDLTQTIDGVRDQPVIKINCITTRKNPIYQTLLPGLSEHKILMGMPKEPTIYNEVDKVARCENVLLTTGGNSWLHAVVQIDKKNNDDGKKAIEAAFKGHGSLKHCVVVDKDIDIYNPEKVERAIATRFQADRDLMIMKDQPSSSLDPSAIQKPGEKARTAKMGIDATIPEMEKIADYTIIDYPKIDPKKYI